MDSIPAVMDIASDLALQAILGRSADLVNGIDNEALDFSQLEDFINSESAQGQGTYFGDSLDPGSPATAQQGPHAASAVKLISQGLSDKPTHGHSLPDSPPDSGSEHPYSPSDCAAPPTMYPSLYKTSAPLLDPALLAEGLLLDPRLVEAPLLDSAMADAGGVGHALQEQAGLGDYGTDTRGQQVLFGKNDSSSLIHVAYNPALDVALQNGKLDNGLVEQNLEGMQTQVYTNLQNVPVTKKRKISEESLQIKCESNSIEHNCSVSQASPGASASNSGALDDDYSSEAGMSESQYQTIRFTPFQQTHWHSLTDQNLTELSVPHYRVDADKGFNFSNADDAFVCQKKNHFQITCHVQLLGDAQFVKTAEGFQKISSFHLHFYGVKHDCPTQTIRVEQSQSDRSKKPFHPVLVELVNSQVTKVTVGRLHFSETTSNNMRKKGKPNPEQRYFQLVVGLHAHTTNGNFPVISHASQKIIVRASNPGQFESDVELCWQKGQTIDSVCHSGKVGINTDRPDEALVVHGNIKLTGHIVYPSDMRAKRNIVECNTAQQLRNVQNLRVVKYEYEPEFASQLSRYGCCTDTGVIAQEVAKVIPEAVRPAGDLLLASGTYIDNFLVVNKERIFMENIGAVKELCKVTDNLETRIDQLERINRRLNKLKRGDSLKSTSTVSSMKHSHSNKCLKHHHSCEKEDELCSNKFIQIVIVILVIIMALCLAAITTLYLIEAARHTHFVQNNLKTASRTPVTKRPLKSKPHSWLTNVPYHTTPLYRTEDIMRITIDSSLIRKSPFVIGKPPECLNDAQLDNGNSCRVYCCAPPGALIPSELYSEKRQSGGGGLGASNRSSGPLLNVEKNKISKPFHSNDIDKQVRQRRRREAYDVAQDENAFDASGKEDQLFHLLVQGKYFNTTLTAKYLMSVTNSYNFSYSVPISKYMPDDVVYLIFRSTQANIKEIVPCPNAYVRQQCPYAGELDRDAYSDERERTDARDRGPSQLLGSRSASYEVAVGQTQARMLTFRASLTPNQGICNLPDSKLGLEFVEYNFYFYRHCDE